MLWIFHFVTLWGVSEFILYLNSADFIVGQSSQRYYCAVTIGDDAVISAFRLVRF